MFLEFASQATGILGKVVVCWLRSLSMYAMSNVIDHRYFLHAERIIRKASKEMGRWEAVTGAGSVGERQVTLFIHT